MIRVAHVITTLSTGGAETMLYKLLCAMDRERFSAEVFAFGGGAIGQRIARELDIPVVTFGREAESVKPSAAARVLAQLLGRRRQLIQTWMYHANLLGGIAGRALGAPVIWNIRRGSLEHLRRRTRWVARTCSFLSRAVPARIVCCSSASLEEHAIAGYDRARMEVIPNGFDLARYQPDASAREALRQGLGIGAQTPVVGLVARYDPCKDHATFLKAAALVHSRHRRVRFLLCGQGVDGLNTELVAVLQALGLEAHCSLLGRFDNIPRHMSALDLLMSSSACVGFPNVLGEAMACGVPCVATDVGDSRSIVGTTGRLCPPGDSQALATACLELLDMPAERRAELGAAARLHIERNYSLRSVAARYEHLYTSVLEEQCAA